ncbi:hypothetical protein GCM10009647_080300 [Streptomyces sanglieri]
MVSLSGSGTSPLFMAAKSAWPVRRLRGTPRPSSGQKGSAAIAQRQYEHIKESAQKRGASEGRAKELAARTVNKERARSGEARTASRTSLRETLGR